MSFPAINSIGEVEPPEIELCDPSLVVTGPGGIVAEFSWDYRLIVVSLAVAIAGSFAALEVAQRFRSAEKPQHRQLLALLGATLMGLAIWTMHFVGMLALKMPMHVAYKPDLTIASLFAAATGAGIAFSVIRRRKLTIFHLLTGGTAMGIAIAGMHYLGMASMEMGANIDYEPVRFAGSIALAITAATGALFLAFAVPANSRYALALRGGSAVVMGFAIAGMHYLGMWAARYSASELGLPTGGKPMVGGIELGTITVIAGGVFGVALIAQALRSSVEKDRALAEQRRLAEELERHVEERTQELQVANRDLSNFAYTVSHDLRSPLRVIVGFSGLLEQENAAALNADARERLHRITAAGVRMDAMLSGLLELAHASTTPLKVSQIDLSELVRAIGADVASGFPEKSVRLEVQPGVTARGDATLLTSVLQNLLGNAWKFNCAGNAIVAFSAAQRDGDTVYIVEDNGPGFAPDAAERIFAMFERLDNSTPGMGIGLAVSRRIIERHGGRLWAESTPGKGATFLFTLPAIDESY